MGTNGSNSPKVPTGVENLIVSAFGLPEEGGIQRSIHQIASALGAAGAVMVPEHVGAREFDQGCSYSVIRKNLFGGRWRPRWVWLIGWVIKQRRWGLKRVIFGHLTTACLAGLVWRFFGVEYVLLVHGRDVLTESKRLPQWLWRKIFQRAAWVGVNSTYVASMVRQYGVPEAHVVRTHPALPDEKVSGLVENSSRRVMVVGRLVKRKNFDNILRAVAVLFERGENVSLDIVGSGPEDQALRKLAESLHIQDRVAFHGAVDDAKRDWLLSRASAFALVPWKDEKTGEVEGLGLALLEAGGAGVAIVTSPHGGTADIVGNGKYGWVADPGNVNEIADRISQAIASKERDGMRRGLQNRIRTEFTWSVRNRRVRLMLGLDAPRAVVGAVIPAYNVARSIGLTLKDLLSQSVPPQEIVVVDDGSTDELGAALESEVEDSHVRLIRQENRGAAAARNTGLASLVTEYVICVDADMRLHRKLLERLAVALETHPEATFAYPSFRFGPKTFRLFDYSLSELKLRNFIHTTALVRRSRMVSFDTSLKKFQDWDVWLTLAERGDRGIWVPQVLFNVDQAGGTMSKWLPKFVYRLPYFGSGAGSRTIRRYRDAERIIRRKHGLV